MTLTGEEILKYPEFHAELWRLCQEHMGPGDKLNYIDFITDESDWIKGVKGYNIRYHYNNVMYWRTIDTHNSSKLYKKLSEEIKVILRDNKLERLGI